MTAITIINAIWRREREWERRRNRRKEKRKIDKDGDIQQDEDKYEIKSFEHTIKRGGMAWQRWNRRKKGNR